MKNKTQEECRQDWEDFKLEILAKIDSIDDNTPASPHDEPKWWVGMTDIEDILRNPSMFKIVRK